MPKQALIVIDVQNDFCPGGALMVPEGDQVIPVCNQLMDNVDLVVLTQDWHPVGHASFASTHQVPAFSTIKLSTGPQTAWPDHCVQGTTGATFHPALHHHKAHAIIRKGMNPNIDSYSGFLDNDRTHRTGLAGLLQEHNIEHLVLTGLALDFCVQWTALDAIAHGFRVEVIEAGVRAISEQGAETAWKALETQGVTRR